MLPESLKPKLLEHLERVQRLHKKDLALGSGRFTFQRLWRGSFPAPRRRGSGSSCFRLRSGAKLLSAIPATSRKSKQLGNGAGMENEGENHGSRRSIRHSRQDPGSWRRVKAFWLGYSSVTSLIAGKLIVFIRVKYCFVRSALAIRPRHKLQRQVHESRWKNAPIASAMSG